LAKAPSIIVLDRKIFLHGVAGVLFLYYITNGLGKPHANIPTFSLSIACQGHNGENVGI
jgi:hypothetical protein